MSPFLIILLLFLPLFNAARLQTELENNNDMLIQRSVAANYLLNLPLRQYQHQVPDSDSSSLSVTSDRGEQQRAKRIYWENLAFHAADYNQKPKKG